MLIPCVANKMNNFVLSGWLTLTISINAEHNHGRHELLRKQYSEVFIKSNSEYGNMLKELDSVASLKSRT